jgi:hypothetical protein
MNPVRVLVGLAVSSIAGSLVLWVLIDKLAWGYLKKTQNIEPKPPGVLSIPLGIVERILYTTSFILGAPSWVGIWLVVKVAVQWDRWTGKERATYNVFLIGSALSILFGFIGAWIAIGKLPVLSSP